MLRRTTLALTLLCHPLLLPTPTDPFTAGMIMGGLIGGGLGAGAGEWLGWHQGHGVATAEFSPKEAEYKRIIAQLQTERDANELNNIRAIMASERFCGCNGATTTAPLSSCIRRHWSTLRTNEGVANVPHMVYVEEVRLLRNKLLALNSIPYAQREPLLTQIDQHLQTISFLPEHQQEIHTYNGILHDTTIQQLRNDKDALKASRDRFATESTYYQNQYAQSEENLTQCKSDKRELNAKKSSLSEKLRRKKNELEQSQRESAQIRREKNALQADKEKIISELEQRIQKLESQNGGKADTIRRQLEEIERLKQQLQQASNTPVSTPEPVVSNPTPTHGTNVGTDTGASTGTAS